MRFAVNFHKIFKWGRYNAVMDTAQTVKQILVVDDEPQIVKVLWAYLERAGYGVISAGNGRDALAVFRQHRPDFVILDLNLPVIDGLDVCRTIRRESNVPILMLTARVEEADRLVGLELGADDYVVKPFSPREVVARVKTIFRRAAPAPENPEVIAAGDLRIDVAEHAVSCAGKDIDLTPTEFAILVVLASQPRRVLSRMQIMEQAQGEAFEGYERTIDAHIKNLRNKLEPDPKKPVYIRTVFGVGYKFDPQTGGRSAAEQARKSAKAK